MKAIFCLIFLLASSFASQSEDIRPLFETWKVQFEKTYIDSAEEEYRFQVFTSTYKFIEEYNAKGKKATLALNQFSDLTSEEFGSIFAKALPVPEDGATLYVQDPENIEYPSDWNWYPQAVTGIKNQQQCGSCWAFAAVAVSESAYYFATGNLVDFSEQQLVDCETNCDGCNGGYPSYALQYIAANGLEYSDEYPYVAYQQGCQYNGGEAVGTSVTGAVIVQAQNNPAALYNAIYGQPTTVLIEANQPVFQSYSSGILSGSDCGDQIDHAVTAVGYGSNYFIIKNSWGTSWGMGGFVWIDSTAGGSGTCGILTQPAYPSRN